MGNSVIVSAIGGYVPKKVIDNNYLESVYDTTAEWIVNRIGADNRHFASPEEATSDLAIKAARECLKSIADKDTIDCIILSTVTPDNNGIPTAPIIQNALDIEGIPAYDIREGCSGALYAIEQGVMLIKANHYKRVLVIASETLSKFMDYSDRTMASFFGDGAGCVLLEKSNDTKYGYEFSYMNSDPSIYESLIIPMGGTKNYYRPENFDLKKVFWRMNGADIYEYAIRVFDDISRYITVDRGMNINDIDRFIFHQANRNIIEDILKRHDISKDKTYITIDKYANTGSSSVLLCLRDAVNEGFIRSGDRVLLSAFGAGGNYGAISIVWK